MLSAPHRNYLLPVHRAVCLARELRRRSATRHAGVVVDRDAVPEGEIDRHSCIVAKEAGRKLLLTAA
jgi:hypothetical protein